MTISQQEVFINEMSADIEVVRSVLIAFVLGSRGRVRSHLLF